ncbi:EVE domain-containing protein [Methanocalculus taiwanensis]|uniref:EVE domain-containing protein n=1 Tax=Methanocalculus taiwanensis TaxID=106207 RepID=A0ABD4TIJ2_9EURY|nr:EVE domain-containing protein [Methanocalculus taiwanensis]MCQ1537758.1 EVE domain-containing protein [Methanocalculus taiwanensis]
MRIWIEVASGNWAWENKLKDAQTGEKIGLKAPATTRYFNLLKDVRDGDILFTHLTHSLTSKKEWRGAIVGISSIASSVYNDNKMIRVDTNKNITLPIPIRFAEYKDIETISENFLKIIKRSMQKYLFEITGDDFQTLIHLHEENANFLKKTEYSMMIEAFD